MSKNAMEIENSNNYNVSQDDIDKLLDLYFKQPKVLYDHLFSSFHQMVEEIIPYCLTQEKNTFHTSIVKDTVYTHGIKCTNIGIKPSVFDNNNEIKFPTDARKNHLNYFATIVADIVQIVEKEDFITGNKTVKEIGNIAKETAIANIPIMVKSKYCSTNIKKDLKNECRYDPGGYFIVTGMEKVVMSIEKMVSNKTLVFTKKEPTFPDGQVYIAQINSQKNDWSDNLQIISIKNKKDNDISITTSSIVDIPLFILFRALGVESDQDIISHITYDLSDVKMINLIRSSMERSVDDNGVPIRTREEAYEFLINKLRRNKLISQSDDAVAKNKKIIQLDRMLRNDLFPHLGEDIPKKICYLGYMTNKLLNVWLNRIPSDDRDALQNKRIETPGILISQLFRQNWKKMLNEIGKLFIKKNQSDEQPINILHQLKPGSIEQGIKTALATGIWGVNKVKKGVAQSLQRLSWLQGISYLRRVMSPSLEAATSKITSIRQTQNLQIQMLCVTGDTEVLMSNRRDTKLIKNMNNNDFINSVNPTSLMDEPSSIHSYFCKMPLNLFEVTTLSGRKIKATNDHPFLVNNNGNIVWKCLKDLTENDNLIIHHIEKHIPYGNDDIKTTMLARLYGYLNFTSDNISGIVNEDINYLGFKNVNDFQKTHSDLNIVPSFIKNGDLCVKRAFIVGIHCSNNIMIDYKSTDLTLHFNNMISETYLNNISDILNDFNISHNNMFNSINVLDVNKYFEHFGFAYNESRRIMLAPFIEYNKMIEYDMNNTNYSSFIKNNVLPNGCVSVPIKNITSIPVEPVYDFTTLSSNHSFIASSFVTHNCPAETPEGAKIGIVKSLSMMAGISNQNSSQAVIVKTLLDKTDMKHPADIEPLEMNNHIKIFLNGDWVGVSKMKEGLEIYNMLKSNRRKGVIDKFTTICLDYTRMEIKVYYDGGRLIRPLLVVSNNKTGFTKELMKDIDEEIKNKNFSKGWNKILSKYPNLVDYEDVESSGYIMCADRYNRLDEAEEARNRKVVYTDTSKVNRYGDYRWIKYTHCDFHSWTQLGIIAGNIPFSNHNHAGRNIIHFSQAKQSISLYLTSYKDRMDISQVLYYPQIPITTTKTMEYNNCLDLPYGENAIVAILSYNGLIY
jgi:DNA-directed RNA polymerase beta subunit